MHLRVQVFTVGLALAGGRYDRMGSGHITAEDRITAPASPLEGSGAEEKPDLCSLRK